MDGHNAHDTDIPKLLPPHESPPITSPAGLLRQWRALMGPLGFDDRALWFMVLDSEGRPTPLLSRIEELPDLPDRRTIRNLVDIVGQVTTERLPGGSTAFLLARPGRARLTQSDLAWGFGVVNRARLKDVSIQPFFFATDEGIVSLDSSRYPKSAA